MNLINDQSRMTNQCLTRKRERLNKSRIQKIVQNQTKISNQTRFLQMLYNYFKQTILYKIYLFF